MRPAATAKTPPAVLGGGVRGSRGEHDRAADRGDVGDVRAPVDSRPFAQTCQEAPGHPDAAEVVDGERALHELERCVNECSRARMPALLTRKWMAGSAFEDTRVSVSADRCPCQRRRTARTTANSPSRGARAPVAAQRHAQYQPRAASSRTVRLADAEYASRARDPARRRTCPSCGAGRAWSTLRLGRGCRECGAQATPAGDPVQHVSADRGNHGTTTSRLPRSTASLPRVFLQRARQCVAAPISQQLLLREALPVNVLTGEGPCTALDPRGSRAARPAANAKTQVERLSGHVSHRRPEGDGARDRDDVDDVETPSGSRDPCASRRRTRVVHARDLSDEVKIHLGKRGCAPDAGIVDEQVYQGVPLEDPSAP